ncbi:hypothetical protein JHW43_007362 [Diplocarpon mali]|nr:hypothetical protein JHW43_007362 [Diplocarpon mali]
MESDGIRRRGRQCLPVACAHTREPPPQIRSATVRPQRASCHRGTAPAAAATTSDSYGSPTGSMKARRHLGLWRRGCHRKTGYADPRRRAGADLECHATVETALTSSCRKDLANLDWHRNSRSPIPRPPPTLSLSRRGASGRRSTASIRKYPAGDARRPKKPAHYLRQLAAYACLASSRGTLQSQDSRRDQPQRSRVEPRDRAKHRLPRKPKRKDSV